MNTPTIILIVAGVALLAIAIRKARMPKTVIGTIKNVRRTHRGLIGYEVTAFEVEVDLTTKTRKQPYAFGVDGHNYEFRIGRKIEIWPTYDSIMRSQEAEVIEHADGTSSVRNKVFVWYQMKKFRFIDEEE